MVVKDTRWILFKTNFAGYLYMILLCLTMDRFMVIFTIRIYFYLLSSNMIVRSSKFEGTILVAYGLLV